MDVYTWKARITPLLLVLLPLGIGIGVCFPEVPIVRRLAAVVLAPTLLAALISRLGRVPGQRKQGQLWERWGGAPTTRLLRYRDTTLSSSRLRQYHEKLQRLLPSVKLPSDKEEELDDPRAADDAYEACADFLRVTARNDPKRFPWVAKENVNYGFSRNLWGMKPAGIGFAIAGLVASGVALWLLLQDDGSLTAEWVLGSVVNLLFLGMWLFWIRPDMVRAPAEAYAARLLEAVDDQCDEQEARAKR